MSPELAASLWPIGRIGEALVMLAGTSNLLTATYESPGALPAEVSRDLSALEQWMDAAAALLKVEVEPFRPPYQKIEESLRRSGPVLLTFQNGSDMALVAIAGLRGRAASVVCPDGTSRRVALHELLRIARVGIRENAQDRVDSLLDRACVSGERRTVARQAILDEELNGLVLDAGFSLSLPPHAAFRRQVGHARLPARAVGVISCHLLMLAFSAVGWWLVGYGALEGRLEPGWLVAWGLLLVTLVPLRVLAGWWQGTLALDFATLLRRRMLWGALRLDPEETRHEGAGQLLGRAIESEAIESLITSGGLASLLSVLELVAAGVVLALGPTGLVSTLLLAGWVGLVVALFVLYLGRLRAWTAARMTMTQDLVERMVGHRTRLAQEPRETWHDREDDLLHGYASRSLDLDRLSTWILAVLPRAWFFVGLASLVPALLDPGRSPSHLAVGVGGVVLAYRALSKLTGSVSPVFGAVMAWSQAGPLFRAGAREDVIGRAALAMGTSREHRGSLIEARGLSLRQPERKEPVLRNVAMRIAPGDRILLEGPSGSGKSTLGAVLTGLRAPDHGLLLLSGLDRHALGMRAWRRRVVAAPQFHENHVLSATFAFNLLMGRRWPPRGDDLKEAVAICEELGLGELLERMPSGLMQNVGETGWQLSHGERSRLYIARALLQEADMIVLDESFAALDPVTLERSLRCVLSRAPTLLVIAHP